MKAIINGLRYDTDKAELLGSDRSGGNDRGNFRWFNESLYRTPRGKRYFLAGEGNGMTRYASGDAQSGWSYGRRIIPLTKEEAQEWAERELKAAEVEAIFADSIEDA